MLQYGHAFSGYGLRASEEELRPCGGKELRNRIISHYYRSKVLIALFSRPAVPLSPLFSTRLLIQARLLTPLRRQRKTCAQQVHLTPHACNHDPSSFPPRAWRVRSLSSHHILILNYSLAAQKILLPLSCPYYQFRSPLPSEPVIPHTHIVSKAATVILTASSSPSPISF